jgi:ferredoxin--NADP+ reductase
MFKIVDREELAPGVHRFTIDAPLVARKAQPGQFVILIVDEKGERVPFTISDWDHGAGTVDFVFCEVGRTTRQMARLQADDGLAHFIGPLGKPSHIDTFGHVVCVVSGYGIAGMVPVIRALKEKGNRITTIMQVPDDKGIFGQGVLEDLSDKLIVTIGGDGQDNGSTALKPLRQLLSNHPRQAIDRVMAMCSLCLMRLMSEMTRPHQIETLVHLAPVMVDGTGMCGACRVIIGGETRFACVHGPEFNGQEVSWDMLMSRRCTYADENILQQSYQCRSCSQW